MKGVCIVDKKDLINDSKYVLILYLFEKKKLTIPKIIKLNPKDATGYFDKDMDNTVAECLKAYVNKNIESIKASNFFFPGRDGGEAKINSILSGLRKYLIKQGRSLAELGLASRASDVDGIPDDADSPEDVANALKSLFK